MGGKWTLFHFLGPSLSSSLGLRFSPELQEKNTVLKTTNSEPDVVDAHQLVVVQGSGPSDGPSLSIKSATELGLDLQQAAVEWSRLVRANFLDHDKWTPARFIETYGSQTNRFDLNGCFFIRDEKRQILVGTAFAWLPEMHLAPEDIQTLCQEKKSPRSILINDSLTEHPLQKGDGVHNHYYTGNNSVKDEGPLESKNSNSAMHANINPEKIIVGQFHWLAVDENYRGLHLGELLLKKVCDFLLLEKHCNIAMLRTEYFRLSALKIYIRQGFIPLRSTLSSAEMEEWAKLERKLLSAGWVDIQ